MKPSEITYDMVRAIMEKSATWVDCEGAAYRTAATGYKLGAEDVVWFLHGYDPMIKDRAARHESREAAKKTFGPYITAPTSAQIQKCRQLLHQLVDEGLVRKHEHGNHHSFTWITAAMLLAKSETQKLATRVNELSAELTRLLPQDERADYSVLVSAQTVEMSMKRGAYQGRVTLQLGIEAAQRLHDILKAVEDRETIQVPDGRQYTIVELPSTT